MRSAARRCSGLALALLLATGTGAASSPAAVRAHAAPGAPVALRITAQTQAAEAAPVPAHSSKSSAAAEPATITAQAQAADASFLAYAPAPPDGPGALCLVDTGVFSNPDTAPGLVSATALEAGGSGSDVDPDGHGTTMAMIAGGAGHGVLGAWPQIRIVSVRATSAPAPGQEPTFEFPDYAEGIEQCLQQQGSFPIEAIDLALSSTISPSTDESQTLQNTVAQADAHNVAILAAAGNVPGPVQEPGAEPGIFAVGAFSAQADQTSPTAIGAICSFSANTGLTFFGPGCGLDEAEPFTDTPSCCGNGTSQASAFTAAVLVALMSYDPGLSASAAEQLLVGSASDGDLDAAAAFDAAGLASVVEAGNKNIPTGSTAPSHKAGRTPGKVKLRRLSWRHGVLYVEVARFGRAQRLSVRLIFAHGPVRRLRVDRARLRVRSRRPDLVKLRLLHGKAKGPVLKVRVKR